MSFNTFDEKEQETVCKEAENRWGDTAAWSEYLQKNAGRCAKAREAAEQGLINVLAKTGRLKNLPVNAPEVQTAVTEIKAYISENFYTCTNEIFAGLGRMYAADPRFKENIDRACGDDTAEFLSKAIAVYCEKKK